MIKLETKKAVSMVDVAITNDVEKSSVTATVRYADDKIISIENGVVTIDGVHVGNFMVAEASRPTIHNMAAGKIAIVGTLVDEAIVEIEKEFA